jgi:hypothetical protein
MRFHKLEELIDDINDRIVLEDKYSVPTGVSILSGWIEAFDKISLKKDQMILVERTDMNFYRSCKIKQSFVSFSELAYDKIKACRTTKLFIIDGMDGINDFFKSFAQCKDLYRSLSQVKNYEINYREPLYYREASSFIELDESELWMVDGDDIEDLSYDEIYDLYLLDVIDEDTSFDADSPFSEEDYEIINSWVEIESSGEKLEDNQIYSKKIHGRMHMNDLSVSYDGYRPSGEESEPYIREVVIGNNLISVNSFYSLVDGVVGL